jgi:UDP-2,3-diacylglucosamine pyrophosphatase LpxH
VSKTDKNVLIITMDVNFGWTQRFLLRSDAHHDNIDCRQDLEKDHLDEAKKDDAGIIDTGDLFCAMQGKYDPRKSKSKCRPEHQVDNYLDALVYTAADFYEPYAKNFVSLGIGNHESAVKKNHETDLSQRLADRLNDRTGSQIAVLGYTGWIKFHFKVHKTHRERQVLWYTHGYGGGGPVTHDYIQSTRQQVYIENADIMCSGHVHRSWLKDDIKLRLKENGQVERRQLWYVKLPTYKDAYKKGQGCGFEVEKGHGPRPLGAWWLEFTYHKDNIRTRIYKA